MFAGAEELRVELSGGVRGRVAERTEVEVAND